MFAVMVDRGTCTFVQKTSNIQHLGALAALIADYVQEQNVVMVDQSGLGTQLHIPSFIVARNDSQLIKDHYDEEEDIMIKVELEIGNGENRVAVDVWYGGGFDFRREDIRVIRDVYQRLVESNAVFEPRIYTYSCLNCSDRIKQEYCVSNGQYCPFWPHLDNIARIDYSEFKLRLLRESLRQKCLFARQPRTHWFDYLESFLQECIHTDSRQYTHLTSVCSRQIVEGMGLNWSELEDCVDRTFEKPGDYNSDNLLLKADSRKRD